MKIFNFLKFLSNFWIFWENFQFFKIFMKFSRNEFFKFQLVDFSFFSNKINLFCKDKMSVLIRPGRIIAGRGITFQPSARGGGVYIRWGLLQYLRY